MVETRICNPSNCEHVEDHCRLLNIKLFGNKTQATVEHTKKKKNELQVHQKKQKKTNSYRWNNNKDKNSSMKYWTSCEQKMKTCEK